jgi:D-alanyl-D-alanine carboxypeptidase
VYTTGIYHVSGAFRIRSVAYADLKALADAARAAGAAIDLTSTYRSYASQQATYDYYVKWLGAAGGLLRAARPGHSEHQLGTAIDVKGYQGVSPMNYTDWTVTKPGAWMRDNAWRYGWVMSYPKAASPAVTCYQYEPWHYRYVGRTVAKAVHDSGLTLRGYLWRRGSIAPGA